MGRRFVLIGAGQASISAARTLRRNEFDGDIVVIGDEPHIPYQRPPLSKEYLQGEAERDEILAAPEDWFEVEGIELRLGVRATRIDTESLDVDLDDGSRLSADAILIATGGTPRRFAGYGGKAVCYLRTLDDANRIQKALKPDSRVIIVGGGFIGLEIAATARKRGADVTLLEALEVPLERALGLEVGAVCAAVHEENGVRVKTGASVERIEDGDGCVIVTTSGGEAIQGDLIVVGIGIVPNDQIARDSEITVGNGIRVDEFCRTSADGVYAAGDVANHYHPLYDCRLRVEHFDNATRQGAAAAKNMMGTRTEYAEPHWFWSDQYDHSLQYAGHAERWDEIVFRGSVEDRDFTAFYMRDGRVQAAFGLNRGEEVMLAKELIAGRAEVDISALQNDELDFHDIVFGEEEAAGGPEDDAGQAEGDFQFAARSGQVREGTVRRFAVGGLEVAIARYGDQIYALHNLCTHLACHLASGKVEDGGLVCLCHGSIFELTTGIPINPPATRPVKTYPVREVDGRILVNVSA